MSKTFKVLHAFVTGRVQGVFFRHNTKKLAKKIRLTGYVKNLRDGRVEVYAEGSEDLLQELLKFLHEGPPMATVDKVEANWLDDKSRFYDEFGVEYDR